VSTIDASAPIGGRPRAAGADTHRLRREIGVVGLLFTSVGSIIGSGWLFAPLTAALLVGGAAVIDWVIAGVIVIVLALCHA
jgi:amino acid transporter